MSTTNVNGTKIAPPDKADYSYGGGVSKPLPPKGEYLFRTTKVELGRTNSGHLQAVIDAVIVAPGTPADGFETRFNRVNTKNWPNKPINGAAEYLRSIGAKTTPQTDAEYEAALKASVNSQFRGILDWEAYDSNLGVNLKGMGSFPLNTPDAKGVLPAPKLPANTPLPYVMAGAGGTEKVYANARIKFFNKPS